MTKDELKQELLRYRNCKESFQQVSTFLVEAEHRMSRILGSEVPTTELVSQYVTLQEAYRSAEIELLEAQIRIEDLIECLDSRERYLMRCYYIQGMTWEEVCHTAGYCLRTAHRIHNDALRRILQKMPQHTANIHAES